LHVQLFSQSSLALLSLLLLLPCCYKLGELEGSSAFSMGGEGRGILSSASFLISACSSPCSSSMDCLAGWRSDSVVFFSSASSAFSLSGGQSSK